MTTTHRRITTAPPSIFDRTEETRLADRARLFRELAERKEREASLRSLEAALRELDSAADDAADQHNTAAGPLQAELASPSIAAARRSKLLDELAVLNDVLEKKVQSLKAIRKPLAKQKQEIQALVSPAVAIESRIMQSAPLSDRCEHWTAQRGLKFAHERARAAQQNHRAAADELRQAQDEPRKYDLIQFLRRELEWAAELASSQRMLDMAREESDAAQAKLMQE